MRKTKRPVFVDFNLIIKMLSNDISCLANNQALKPKSQI